MQEQFISSADGTKIFTRCWQPAAGARAILILVHGFNSHSGYFTLAADELSRAGFVVHALDLRGRGRSEGERFYVADFADYLRDVDALVGAARRQSPGLPVFILGHSAGGVVACNYALDHQAGLAGLICESFAYQVPAPDFALAVLKGLSHVAPHAHVLKLKNEDFSRDPKVVEQMNHDPLLAHETQPTKTVAEMVRADERLKKEFPQIKLPVLILHGTADKATKPSGSKRFYEMAGSSDKTLKLYEGHYHDLLNDQDKEAVLGDIVVWVEARLPADGASG